ncbi:uncharacterized protein LOC143679780 [Tamandua tetradactyla]|uniref:uncharacterized protein LOC143679780 n=1 Tax=Tamandua tetradactyla TaxID=48850 RepID=UPI0040539D97
MVPGQRQLCTTTLSLRRRKNRIFLKRGTAWGHGPGLSSRFMGPSQDWEKLASLAPVPSRLLRTSARTWGENGPTPFQEPGTERATEEPLPFPYLGWRLFGGPEESRRAWT